MSFVHLHTHSDFSLLDGACRIPEMIEITLEQNAPAVALTDHGNMFGALEFYTQAREAGIKPIIGCEFYVAPKSRHEKKKSHNQERHFHETILVKNITGYRNLVKLTSEAYISGFYYKPRIDKELLSQYHEGLICLSGCIQGELPQLLLNDDLDAARKLAQFYLDLFGDDYYIEIQRHHLDDQEKVLPYLAQLAEDMGIKLVASNDAHYLKREHAAAHDVLLCIGTQSQRTDEKRLRFSGSEFYLKSEAEMRELLPEYPDAIETTLEIAEKCDLEIPLGKHHFPIFQLPDEQDLTADIFLERLTREGLTERYGDSPDQGVFDRMEIELGVISQTGFSNYFLIVSDFVRWAKEHQVPVGPGRGSAAGCLVSYCLGITNLDPIEYGLIFERFLNPERVSPPDIDIDFADNRREEVIAYVREKYGQDSVCRITTFGRMAAKSAIRDVARTLSVTYAEGDKIARLIPVQAGNADIPLRKVLLEVPELKELIDSDPRFQELIDYASILQGSARHSGTHAAGVVICPGPTVDFIPVYEQTDSDELYTQYDMNWVDAMGLLKVDFLGLQTLTELDLTIKALRKKGIEIDLDTIPLDDQKTFQLFGDGLTTGVFQFESSGMRDNLKKLKPERLEDLLAMNALYRPGPMKMIKTYIECRHGQQKPQYTHSLLKPILNDTFGVIVYQEQVMRIATDLAGFSLGKADTLRWAMGKKKKHLMQGLKVEFIDGCITSGIDKKTGEKIYDTCEQFANYGFVKAHAAGYALIAYQCAYLKAHYTADYLAACLTVRTGKADQMMALLEECRVWNIKILPPDINESDFSFTATDEGIRFGMAAIKNVGGAAVKGNVAARDNVGVFTSLPHFVESVDLRVVNKKVIESLIYAGAFDSLGPNRASLFAAIPNVTSYAQTIQDERSRGQTTIFGDIGDDSSVLLPPPDIIEVDEWLPSELQSHEKDVLGYYITGHPLERFRREVKGFSTHHLDKKDNFTDGMNIRICGVITSARKRHTRKGKLMAIIRFEDLGGTIECLAFSETVETYEHLMVTDRFVGISGRIGRQDENDEPKLWVDEIIELEQVAAKWGRLVKIRISNEMVTEPLIDRLVRIVSDHPGKCPFYIDLLDDNGHIKKLKVGHKYSVNPVTDLIDRLVELFGEDGVSVG
ncbi:MAG: DNA polymerase III subunit alpha [Candidatus Electryoneaceae bacterium]|nr:DNA polymerase III subunit alpha [Candidatus Electryoneaceae bacterium]